MATSCVFPTNLPIVVKEALALLYVLQRVACLVSNVRVDCFVDSATLVACWKKKDGSRNALIKSGLKEIFHLTLSANLHIILHFVPSQNNPADSPSRIPSVQDCLLSLASWRIVDRAFGPHAIDRMATFNGIFECSKFARIKLSYRRRQCFLLYSEL